MTMPNFAGKCGSCGFTGNLAQHSAAHCIQLLKQDLARHQEAMRFAIRLILDGTPGAAIHELRRFVGPLTHGGTP